MLLDNDDIFIHIKKLPPYDSNEWPDLKEYEYKIKDSRFVIFLISLTPFSFFNNTDSYRLLHY